MNGISALIKETPERALSSSTTWVHSEKMATNLTRHPTAGTIILDVPLPCCQNGEINVCGFNHPLYIIFVIAALMKWDRLSQRGVGIARLNYSPASDIVSAKGTCTWVISIENYSKEWGDPNIVVLGNSPWKASSWIKCQKTAGGLSLTWEKISR